MATPAALLVTVSQGVFRGLQDMRTPLAVTVATNVVHLALDWLLMFHWHWGLQVQCVGLGWAGRGPGWARLGRAATCRTGLGCVAATVLAGSQGRVCRRVVLGLGWVRCGVLFRATVFNRPEVAAVDPLVSL